MRRGFPVVARIALATLGACAATEPPPATARIVGAGERVRLVLRDATLEVPSRAAARLEATLVGPGRARLTLGGAGLGATEDALLDAAEDDFRALAPDAQLRRTSVRWWGRVGRALVAEGDGPRRERRVLLRSPWRAATLALEGPAVGIDAGADAALAFLGLRLGSAGWQLAELRLASEETRLQLTNACEGALCRPCGERQLTGKAVPGADSDALRRVWRALRCR